MKLFILVLFVFFTFSRCENYTPIVIWHGLGDVCCGPLGLGYIIRKLKSALPGVHVHSIKIGRTIFDDYINSYIMHPDDQIEYACNALKSNPKLANGYNAIGYSQGAQFVRGLAQRCDFPKMKNYVSIGGQQQGVYGLPKCDVLTSVYCDKIRPTVTKVVYNGILQETVTQATFWHDPINRTAYITKNTFFADLNNEININETYVDNLQELENVILVKFEKDDMVQPQDSQWFGFYKYGQSVDVQSLRESDIYHRLGLNKLDSEGKLHLLSLPGNHMEYEWSWFLENILYKFFK